MHQIFKLSRGALRTRWFFILAFCLSSLQGVQADTEASQNTNSPALEKLQQRAKALGVGNISIRERDGVPEFIALLHGLAGDDELYLVGQVSSLREITIQAMPTDSRFGLRGIRELSRLTNLTSLSIECSGALKKGIFREVCKLTQLRRLTLLGACPQEQEYTHLQNLTNLYELRILHCSNFGQREVNGLTRLTNLRNLELRFDGVSKKSMQSETLKNLTN